MDRDLLEIGTVNTEEAKARRHWLDYAAAVFAFVAAIASISAVVVGWMQWDVFKGQLSVLRADQRAWIKADTVLDGDFGFIPGLGSTFPFHFNLTNVGHAPAFNVRTLAFLHTVENPKVDIRAVLKNSYAAWKAESDKDKGVGFIMLPGESVPATRIHSAFQALALST